MFFYPSYFGYITIESKTKYYDYKKNYKKGHIKLC